MNGCKQWLGVCEKLLLLDQKLSITAHFALVSTGATSFLLLTTTSIVIHMRKDDKKYPEVQSMFQNVHV